MRLITFSTAGNDARRLGARAAGRIFDLAAAARFIHDVQAKWSRLMKQTGIKLE